MTSKAGLNSAVDVHFAAIPRRTRTTGYEDVSPNIPFSCAYRYSVYIPPIHIGALGTDTRP